MSRGAPAKRRRVLMVQPSIEPPGGGNAVASWMIEALKADHDVTLLTRAAPDFDRVNRAFGTSLSARDLRVETAPFVLPALLRAARPWVGLALLRDHALLERARAMAEGFDILMTANNESDLGGRGIQYVHFPKFLTTRPDPALRWYQQPGAVRVYNVLCGLATGFRHRRMRANVTLVNSAWTGNLVRQLHRIETVTLHPPVAGVFPEVPWEARNAAFACVGRIAPEKDLETVMSILARVRRRHPDISLRIAGNTDDRDHLPRVQAAARAHGDWVRVELDLARDQLVRLMAGCRYGIHGMRNEHFGTAVAELARAGTIVFAPASGGQVEILADPRLLYEGEDDAAEKIERVLGDRALQRELRSHLGARAEQFSSERFVADFRRIAALFCGW